MMRAPFVNMVPGTCIGHVVSSAKEDQSWKGTDVWTGGCGGRGRGWSENHPSRTTPHYTTPHISNIKHHISTHHTTDFVVAGPDLPARGLGGVLAAGFWGNSWEFRKDTAYAKC